MGSTGKPDVKPPETADTKDKASTTPPTDAASTSSREATRPGDKDALTAVRATPDAGTTPGLPRVDLVVPKPPATIADGAAKDAASQLEAAKDHRFWGFLTSDPEVGKILNILEPQSAANRAKIEEAYATAHPGHNLRDDLKQKLSKEDYAKVEAVLMRRDGKADDAGQIRTALTISDQAATRQESRTGVLNTALDILSPGKAVGDAIANSEDRQKRQLAEADIRKTLGNMTEAQINETRAAYKANYGKDLDQELLNNGNLSQGTREALKILLQGNDHRIGSTPEQVANTLALANLGLKYHDNDMFNQAFQSASPEARKAFLDADGAKRIDAAFSGDEKDKAHSYVERGASNMAMFVEGDTHWYHTNRDEIDRLVTNASDRDSEQYRRGQEAVAKGDKDSDDAKFYTRMHDALKGAAKTDRELADWESKLLKQEQVIRDVLETHDDGTKLIAWRVGESTDRNKLFGAVENLSEQDFNRFKQHPEDLQKLDTALRTFATDEERNRVMTMMRDKLAAPDYQTSQDRGRRSVDDAFKDNPNNTAARVEALSHMTAAEREAYKKDPAHYDDLVKQLPEGVSRFEAQRLLTQVKEGKEPDAVDKALQEAIRGNNPAQMFRAIEDAMKADPTLKDRLANPQTEQDKQLAKYLHDAADNAAFSAYAPLINPEGGGYDIEQYQKMAHEDTKALFDTGHMPLEKMLEFDKDKQSRYKDILGASEADQKRLLEDPPSSPEVQRLQDRAFASPEEKEMLRYALQQGGKIDDADVFRAYTLGSESTPAELRERLDKMTPEQRQELANQYYTKYHKLISADVIDKVPNEEKFRFREMLSPTDVNVRQISLDVRADLYGHTSAFDGIMNSTWDASKQAAIESNNNLNKFITENAAQLDKLTPEQRQQFMAAVDNYQTAIKNYVSSKGELAETVVDAAITIAALGGAAFTGGASLGLLGIIGAGAAGAVFRVAAIRAIEGGDFDSSFRNVSKEAFKGFTAAALSFVGPEMLGIKGVVPVGETIAARTAEGALVRATEGGLEQGALRVSEQVAQTTLKEGLEGLTRTAAIAGGEATEKQISALATRLLVDGASAEQRQLLEAAIRQELVEQVKKGIVQKVILESEALLMNMATGATANSVTEVAATGLGIEPVDTLWQRVSSSAISGAVGGGIFHIGFKALGAGWHGLKAVVGKDEKGLFLGKGTVIEEYGPDGKVKLDATGQPVRREITEERYRPKANERVVENLKDGDPLLRRVGDKSGAPDESAARRGDEAPPKRGDDVDVDGRPKAEGNRERIRSEFKEMSTEEFRASREQVISDLKSQKVGPNESAHDRLMADKTLTPEQKQRVLDMLAEVREHYMSLNSKGKVLADQEVNWIHTQGELARVLESAKANNLTGKQTEDALIASMFSDSAKYTQTDITQNNFWSHHLDGALAASEVLARHGYPPERIDGIVQAIREHQIAPPEFMGTLYRMRIEGTLNARIEAATKAGDVAQVEHLNHLKQILNSDGPEGMLSRTADGRPLIRQIADVNNQPLVRNGNGEYEVKLTPEQRELLRLSGSDGHWYVPKDPTADPEFAKLPKDQQEKLVSQYKVSRALIDGDGIDNYATINGVSKIVKIRGPETFFKDGTVWDSVRSVDSSYHDAYQVLTPEGQRIAEARLGEKNRDLFGADGKFHDYKTNPPADSDRSAEAEMYRWLVAQGRNPSEGIPFYNEALKYPKDNLTPEVKTEVSSLREQLKRSDLPSEQRANLESRLNEISGLDAKQWNDFDFAKQIRDHMTDILRGQARMDGQPPAPFASVRDTSGGAPRDTSGGRPGDLPRDTNGGAPRETTDGRPGDASTPFEPTTASTPEIIPPNNNNALATIEGKSFTFHDNMLRVGTEYGMTGGGVSRRHATVSFDPSTGEMKLNDTSSRGTYIKRKDTGAWERVSNRETVVKEGDIVRLGSENGPELKLRAPQSETFTTGGGNPNVRLFIDQVPVQMSADGTLPVGRSVRGADGERIISDMGVSRDHGSLRYDKTTDTYYFKDNSSAGTFINGRMVHHQEVPIKLTDEIRLGASDGPQLKLISMQPETKFNRSSDAAVFLGGKPIETRSDGSIDIGRNNKQLGITDKRVGREQGSLRWNEADKSFYYRENNSTNRAWLKVGDHYEPVAPGREIKLRPEDDLRLGSIDGPRLELFSKASGTRSELTDRQIFVGGKPMTPDPFTGDIALGRYRQSFGANDNLNLQLSKDHGTLHFDKATGEYTYTDHSTNGSWVKRLDGSVDYIHRQKITLKPGEEVHMGTEDGPIVKVTETPGRKLPDGSTLFRRPDGDMITRPDGTSTFDDRAGLRRTFDARGRITETYSPLGDRKLGYDNWDNLNQVIRSDKAVMTTRDNEHWTVTHPDGSVEHWDGKITVEADGALRYKGANEKTELIRRLDGSEEVVHPNGYVEYRGAKINVETARVEALIQHNFPDAGQAKRFRTMVSEIQSRPDLSTQQKADTIHQINRLLATGNEAALPIATRARLAEQLAFNAAHPELIDQGYNKTCNVTTVEARAFERSPADAVRLVTDVALTGKYTTPTGQTVDAGRVGTLIPDKESLVALQQPYTGTYADLTNDGARSYASQIFEQTAVNINYALHPEDIGTLYRSGDVVQYKKIDVQPGSNDTGERLVIYRWDPKTNQVIEIEAKKAPSLNLSDIEETYKHIVPGRDAAGRPIENPERDFVWASPNYGKGFDTSGFRIRNEQELTNNLLRAQQNGKMPIILTVNANDNLFSTAPRSGHAWHVVCVKSIRVVNGQTRIEFTNQWGVNQNRLGANAVTPAELWRAMQ